MEGRPNSTEICFISLTESLSKVTARIEELVREHESMDLKWLKKGYRAKYGTGSDQTQFNYKGLTSNG